MRQATSVRRRGSDLVDDITHIEETMMRALSVIKEKSWGNSEADDLLDQTIISTAAMAKVMVQARAMNMPESILTPMVMTVEAWTTMSERLMMEVIEHR